MSKYLIKSMIFIFLATLRYSSDGQENTNDAAIKPLQAPNRAQNSILLYKPVEQISQVVRMMFQDSKGNLWFGAENGAWKLTGQTLIHIDSIKSESGGRVTIKDITEGKDGKIWLGHTDGISSIDGELVTNYYESDGLISNAVWCIETDSIGNIWIGTMDGACVFDGKKFKNIELPLSRRDTTVGVSSDKMVNKIFRDKKGTLWITSTAGLFSFENNAMTSVSAKAGFKSNFVVLDMKIKQAFYGFPQKKDYIRYIMV